MDLTEDPVNDNDGSVIPCGNNKFCCAPDTDRGLCDCNTGDGVFSIEDGTAQTIIGVSGLQYTATATVEPSSSILITWSASTAVVTTTEPWYVTSTVVSTSLATSTRVVQWAGTACATMSSNCRTTTSSISTLTTSSSQSLSSTISTTLFSSATGTLSAIAQSSSIASGNSSASDSHKDLTQTVQFKAGVGAGVSVAGLIVIGLIVWYCCCKGGRKPKEPKDVLASTSPVPLSDVQLGRGNTVTYRRVENRPEEDLPNPTVSRSTLEGLEPFPNPYNPYDPRGPIARHNLRDTRSFSPVAPDHQGREQVRTSRSQPDLPPLFPNPYDPHAHPLQAAPWNRQWGHARPDNRSFQVPRRSVPGGTGYQE